MQGFFVLWKIFIYMKIFIKKLLREGLNSGYIYHGTGKGQALNIQRAGAMTLNNTGEDTASISFTGVFNYAKYYASAKAGVSKMAILRTKLDHRFKLSTKIRDNKKHEYVALQPILSNTLEILTPNMKWEPLNSWNVIFNEPLLKEGLETPNIWYHGTRSLLPFMSFDKVMDGSGFVSSGSQRYGGFFFTSEFGNAEYYTEWFVGKVTLNNLIELPQAKHPPTVMKQAIIDKKNYVIIDTLDGSMHSNIAVVPHSNLNDIKILDWEFVSDKEFYFEALDSMFGGDEEGEDGTIYVSQWIIQEFFNMTGGGLDYALRIPIFNEYFNSKTEG